MKAFLHHIFGIFPVFRYPERHRKDFPFVTQAPAFRTRAYLRAWWQLRAGDLSLFRYRLHETFPSFRISSPFVQAVPNNERSNGDARVCSRRKRRGSGCRLGVAPIHGRLGDVSLSANLSECWHCVYWAGRSKCGYLRLSERRKVQRQKPKPKRRSSTKKTSWVLQTKGKELNLLQTAHAAAENRHRSLAEWHGARCE